MSSGFLVTARIDNVTKIPNYPLLEGDLLTLDPEGTFTKECPGTAICNIKLTEEQIASLKPVAFERNHLDYRIVD